MFFNMGFAGKIKRQPINNIALLRCKCGNYDKKYNKNVD
ncbi:hypothetical protein SC1083_1704 [Aggregatibacter actinomycetemcomitans serotype e str. SC1083]|uniref:Uncharacterized protein n=1 Tax=Aggregatibacter actinomycetemcomitans serotype e str. SC1083 TaxID=907488 RepID=G4AA31_AGGAC|nr:hypothetical protein SC1083_1704 [Aggregatibacter actinomycetemcomitans serotype e str. SC1083]